MNDWRSQIYMDLHLKITPLIFFAQKNMERSVFCYTVVADTRRYNSFISADDMLASQL